VALQLLTIKLAIQKIQLSNTHYTRVELLQLQLLWLGWHQVKTTHLLFKHETSLVCLQIL